MDTLTLEYTKRDMLAKYALTRIEEIYNAIPFDKKCFTVSGSKTKVLERALEPIRLHSSVEDPLYTIERNDITMRVTNIYVNKGYSQLEITFRGWVNYENKGEHFELTFYLAKFAYVDYSYSFTSFAEVTPLEAIQDAIESYIPREPLYLIRERVQRRQDLLEAVRQSENEMPYWAYRA